MNILKIGLVLLTGAGFGFGVDKLSDTEVLPIEDNQYYGHMSEEGCHGEGDFLEHMLEELSVEEQVLVQSKIDELLVEYSISLEELNDDYEVRYNLMNDLMIFLDENEIDYHNHGGYYDHDDEEEWHHGMGMH